MDCLEGKNIALRALEPEDLTVLYGWENDPDYWNVGDSREPVSKYAIKEYIAYSDKSVYERRELRLMIVRKEDDVAVGCIDLYDFELAHLRAGVGILVDKAFQRSGYGSEALKVLADYAASYLHIHQLYAFVPLDNKASLRLFESCRFTKEGVLKDWIRVKDGEYKDVCMFATHF